MHVSSTGLEKSHDPLSSLIHVISARISHAIDDGSALE